MSQMPSHPRLSRLQATAAADAYTSPATDSFSLVSQMSFDKNSMQSPTLYYIGYSYHDPDAFASASAAHDENASAPAHAGQSQD